jgi:DNA-directed RNA polymerase subunit RPC12/RpoP
MKKSAKNYICNDCGNNELFISVFTLVAECVVNAKGEEVDGINSKTDNKFCDGDFNTKIESPYKCAKCGSENIVDKNYPYENPKSKIHKRIF